MKMTGKHDGMALAERVRKALAGTRAITEKKMMGRNLLPACDARALKRWLALAERYVTTLPPKRT